MLGLMHVFRVRRIMKRIGILIASLVLAAGIATPPQAQAQARGTQAPAQIKVFEGVG